MRRITPLIAAALLWCAPAAHAQQANGFVFNSSALISVTSVNQNVALPGSGQRVLLQNTGPSIVFVAFGGTSAVASVAPGSSSMPIFPGQCIYMTVTSWTNIAAILSSGAGLLYITQGEGSPPVACGTANPFSAAAGFPLGATALTGNASGVAGAVVGTLTSFAGQFTYICGFNISTIGGTASSGPVTVAGITGSSQTYQLPLNTANGQIVVTQTFSPCIPASAVNTPITVTTAAAVGATAVNVNSWGYRQ